MTAEQLEELLGKVTQGEWTACNMVHADRGDAMTPEEIGEYVCNSVRRGMLDRFLFVLGQHEDGGPADICHTGNGPRGPWNTALIALAPSLARRVLAAEKLVEAAEKVLLAKPGSFADAEYRLDLDIMITAYREASK